MGSFKFKNVNRNKKIIEYISIFSFALFLSLITIVFCKNVDFTKFLSDSIYSSFTINNYKGIYAFYGGDSSSSYTVSNDGTSGQLKLNNKLQTGYIEYKINNLVPNTLYKASAHISTNIESNDSNTGAVIGVYRYSSRNQYFGYSWSKNILGNDTSGKDVTVYFLSDLEGKTSIFIGSQFQIGKIKGTVNFSNLKIEIANSNDIYSVESNNKKVKMIMRRSDYIELASKTNNHADDFAKKYINKLGQIYDDYTNFYNQSSYSTSPLKIFEGQQETLLYTNENYNGYVALAGYPIDFNMNIVNIVDTIIKYNNYNTMDWAVVHEMGHTFDLGKTSDDGNYITEEGIWNFDSEFFASFKPMYEINQGVIRTEDDMFSNFENSYNQSLNNGEYSGDGFTYLLFQIKDSSGNIDWEAFKKTFKWFNDTTKNITLSDNANKFVWFIKKISENSTSGYKNIYNVLMEHSDNLNLLESNFGYKKIDYIYLNDGNNRLNNQTLKINTNKKFKFKTVISTDSTEAGVTFKSSDTSIASVDDFGEVTALKPGVATITAYSFFEQNVSATVTINVLTNEKTIQYQTNNTDINIENTVAGVNEKIVLPSINMPGYTFTGWYSDSLLTKKVGNGGSNYNIVDDAVLYAGWSKNKYTISFNSNGGTILSNKIYNYNEKINNIEIPSREGYIFSDWYTDSKYLTKFNYITMPSMNLILYAKWEKQKYSITFNSNGGTFVNYISAYYNDIISEPQQPTKSGYVFAGWYSDKNFSKKYNFVAMGSKNIVLYAKWNKIYENNNSNSKKSINSKQNQEIYNINFESNGGNSVADIQSISGVKLIEPTSPIKDGYIFAGWYVDKALNIKYNFDTNVTNNFTLYAKWEKAKYSITFNSNGGTPIQIISAYYDDIIEKPNNPTKDDYIFGGWYEDEILSKEFIFDKMPADSKVLYAKWNPKEINQKVLDKDNNVVLENNSYNIINYKKTLKIPGYYNLKITNNNKELTNTELIPTGSVTILYYDGKEVGKHINIIKGDTTKDGRIMDDDVKLVSNYLLNNIGLKDKILKEAADINTDQKIKLSDVVKTYYSEEN